METSKNPRRSVLLKHIERLEARNQLLAEVIAEERCLRKIAWHMYWQRCHGRFWGALNALISLCEGAQRSEAKFNAEVAAYKRRLA